MTPLFDTNAHPRLATAKGPESFSALSGQLRDAGFSGACAVGLPGKDGFAPEAFIAACQAQGFFPVAAWPDTPETAIEGQVRALAAMGYRAIKIHPRLSGLSVRDTRYRQTLNAAADAKFTVFHCSYQFGGDPLRHPTDPLPLLLEAASARPDLRLVLLHGGTVELLRYAEAIRAHRNLLLDLSFTLNRYEGSSLDQDIAFLFRTFDQRICIGSDFPDYTPAEVRRRFDVMAQGLAQDKKDNIGWRNITALLGTVPPAVGSPQSAG